MEILIAIQIVSAAGGLGLSLLVALSRRFGPMSWILALFLIPASLSCVTLASAPWLGGWSLGEVIKLSFSFLVLSAPGGVLFSYTVNREDYRASLKKKRLSASSILAAAPFLVASLYFTSAVADETLRFPQHNVALGPAGFFSALYLLMVSVIVLANLEQTLRGSEEHVRWEIKFLLIGMAVSFSAVVYITSKALLYPIGYGLLSSDAMQLFPIIFLISCPLMLISWRRSSGRGHAVVSHGLVYSSITLLSVGIYLIASSLLARWASQWGNPSLPTEALVFLLSALALAALLLATAFRQRVRRWVRLNLLAGRYDYRRFWLEATGRVHSINPLQVSAASLAELVQQAVGSLDVSVWLRVRHPNRLQLLAARGTVAWSLPAEAFGVVEYLLEKSEPIEVRAGEPGVATRINPAFIRQTRSSLLVPLFSSGRCVGLVTVGPDRTGKPFDWQAKEFLSVLASHAAGEFHKSELLSTLMEAKEMEAFQTFATFLLHDLKNFASTLSLIAQNASRFQDNPEFQRDSFDSVFQTAEKMKRLCNNLRTFSSTLAANKQFEDLNQIIRSIADNLGVSPAAHLKLELGEIPLVMVDIEEMAAVIRNLLINAVEAIAPEGTIAITTTCRDAGVEISVADDGKGMTKEFLNKELFIPFHTTKSDGLGIGLFQSKRIIEAHNGTIHVESEEGKGTTVKVMIPAARQKSWSIDHEARLMGP
jgi:putative PEP-CTERM system histidine kinase